MTPHPAEGNDDFVPLAVALRSGPFHVALRAALRESGLGLESVQRRLATHGVHVSLSTLSYWQRGRSRPERAESLQAVRVLERLLRLPADSLVTLLGPPRPRGRWLSHTRGQLQLDATLGPHPSLPVLLDGIDPAVNYRLDSVLVHSDKVVGPDRRSVSERNRRMLRALEDRADRHVAMYTPSEETQHPVQLGAVTGCRVGRTRSHAGTGSLAAELLFDHPLRTGETCVLEYEYRMAGATAPCTEYYLTFRRPIGQLMVQVRFDQDMLPRRVYRYRQARHDSPCEDLERVELTGTSAHFIGTDLDPAIYGLRWEWD